VNLVNLRADVSVFIARVTLSDLGCALGKLCLKLVGNRLVNENARTRQADLTGVVVLFDGNLGGEIEVGDRTFNEGQMIVLEPTAEPTIKAIRPSTVMVMGGEPVGPRVIWWNFVSSSQAKIDAAKADWKAGRMALPIEDDAEFIPLPDVPSTPEPAPPAV
jgi:hypothetical protein